MIAAAPGSIWDADHPFEACADLLSRYPDKPAKLLYQWHDARLAVRAAGLAFVAAGRVAGRAESRALCEADRYEQHIACRLFHRLDCRCHAYPCACHGAQ